MLRPRFPLVLASGSPRRKELLATLVPEFTVGVPDIDEDRLTVEDPWQTARELARHKAAALISKYPDALIIAGDTVVAVSPDSETWIQLGKPANRTEAERMLSALAGRDHVVITGVALAWPGGAESFAETTLVRFRPLSIEEIEAYAATREPYDKAGGYAIQGGAAGFVTGIEGSHSNVVGLPLEALKRALLKHQLAD